MSARLLARLLLSRSLGFVGDGVSPILPSESTPDAPVMTQQRQRLVWGAKSWPHKNSAAAVCSARRGPREVLASDRHRCGALQGGQPSTSTLHPSSPARARSQGEFPASTHNSCTPSGTLSASMARSTLECNRSREIHLRRGQPHHTHAGSAPERRGGGPAAAISQNLLAA